MKKLPRRLALLFLVAAMLLTAGCKKSEPEAADDNGGGFRIGYAQEGVTIVDDQNALQREYDDMVEAARRPGMTLTYINDAFSEDGIRFKCFLSNDIQNTYDMFIAIYADEDFTDELYLSQLLRPGTAFNEIELEHALEPGDHMVYIAYTQVEEVDGEQQIHAQNIVTTMFHVNPETTGTDGE